MTIQVTCACGKSYNIKDEFGGKKTKCDECGELIGEYTLELKNEAAHGLIRDLSTS